MFLSFFWNTVLWKRFYEKYGGLLLCWSISRAPAETDIEFSFGVRVLIASCTTFEGWLSGVRFTCVVQNESFVSLICDCLLMFRAHGCSRWTWFHFCEKGSFRHFYSWAVPCSCDGILRSSFAGLSLARSSLWVWTVETGVFTHQCYWVPTTPAFFFGCSSKQCTHCNVWVFRHRLFLDSFKRPTPHYWTKRGIEKSSMFPSCISRGVWVSHRRF